MPSPAVGETSPDYSPIEGFCPSSGRGWAPLAPPDSMGDRKAERGGCSDVPGKEMGYSSPVRCHTSPLAPPPPAWTALGFETPPPPLPSPPQGTQSFTQRDESLVVLSHHIPVQLPLTLAQEPPLLGGEAHSQVTESYGHLWAEWGRGVREVCRDQQGGIRGSAQCSAVGKPGKNPQEDGPVKATSLGFQDAEGSRPGL